MNVWQAVRTSYLAIAVTIQAKLLFHPFASAASAAAGKSSKKTLASIAQRVVVPGSMYKG